MGDRYSNMMRSEIFARPRTTVSPASGCAARAAARFSPRAAPASEEDADDVRPRWRTRVDARPAGIETVYTQATNGSLATTTTIRKSSQQQLTTAAIATYDAIGRQSELVEFGSGAQRRTRWLRTGRQVTQEDPDQSTTAYDHNLLGLVTRIRQQRTCTASVRRDDDPAEPSWAGAVGLGRRQPVDDVRVRRVWACQGSHRGGPTRDAPDRSRSTPTADSMLQPSAPTGSSVDTTCGAIRRRMFSLVQPQPLVMATRTFDNLGRLTGSENTNPRVPIPLSERRVRQTLAYDPQGRVERDTQVGQSPAQPVTSTWSLAPGDVWQRTLAYAGGPATSVWRESYDRAFRLARKEPVVGGVVQPGTSFSWIGEIYDGRSQAIGTGRSPFREQVTLDRFGSPLRWRFTAADVDANGQPINAADAAAYCGGVWNTTECALPILDVRTLRDQAGRIVSLQSVFGNPVFSGGTLTSRTPSQPWRGYAYDPMGRLSRLWEHTGVGTALSTTGLVTHDVTRAQIEALGAAAQLWSYSRETAVGGTLAIQSPATNGERWALPVPRGPGHQIVQARIDGQARALQHDVAGHVIDHGTYRHEFDPRGQLAGAAGPANCWSRTYTTQRVN